MRTAGAALLVTLLAGCGSFSLPTPTAAPTVAPSATPVPPTNTPPPPTPTATPVPKLRIGLLDAGELAFGTNLAELLDASAKEFAALNALPYTALAAPDVTAALGLRIAAGDNVIVLAGDGKGAAVAAAATAHADVTFIYFGQPAPAGTENLIVLGAEGFAPDEMGFLAGLAAGAGSRSEVVAAVVSLLNVPGRAYDSGFVNGMRVACSRCKYIQIDTRIYAGRDVQQALLIRLCEDERVDTIWAAPGAGGDWLLEGCAQQGCRVVTNGKPPPVLKPAVAAVVELRPDVPLKAILAALWEGRAPVLPVLLNAASGALQLQPVGAGAALTAADVGVVMDFANRLASGELSTGIDPATGLPF
jgi:basic membrane lipoprotein Med (substrate-binding protein (PBP1-ABC) superfamily)